MHNTDQTVAGLPSARLSQLASPQLMKKFRRDTILGSKHSALRDEMSAILQPNVPDICSRRGNRETETLQGYAGKYTNKINDSTYCHGSKKQSSETNKSDQVATLFASVGSKAEVPHSGLRSLRQYFSPDQLNEAFCTKFHVTDALTGRTEIMTARRPGKASAEVKFTAFDPYVASRARKSSVEKAKDNIEHDILGLMPKENQGVKDFLGTTIRHHRAAALECSENWIIPTESASVCRPLGLPRRREAFPWTIETRNNIAHIYDGAHPASPRVTRSCIRPASIPS
ncbi:uncharacterized protein LOC113147182 [Cyclospora cayetanensis]|uniref:Uncharacterized protein LOC113147182 n=1 Tax=Cyclospora cayetanensis TaxID=88456 RepID=A0A6P6RXQ0_9EIME|nr:uncharacterized protein LOC113147182 [Cyclospora cayetanensis]